TPAEREVVNDTDLTVEFQFDERISERGVRESILVSPSTGVPRVEKGRSEIRVRMPGGWRAGEVYRVVLLPGVRDLFGNETREPASLVFSTGPPVPSTAIGGLVVDRITGRPASDVVVQAVRTPDTVTYSTVGDTSAFFALTNLPTGNYVVSAYIDQNRNRRKDVSESASQQQLVPLFTERDTSTLELKVVPWDTVPARLTRAEPRDSLEVRLFIDDFLDPDTPLDGVTVALFALPDTTPVPGTPRLVRADDYDEEKRAKAAIERPDSAAADTAGAVRRQLPRQAMPPQGPRTPVDTVTLPLKELVLVPAAPLEHGSKYLVRLEGLTNVSGISGGTSQAEFEVPPRPAPVRRDTTRLSAARRTDARTFTQSPGRKRRWFERAGP
ncbi:MAG: carboxypeptidase-like regulatory domain-containing protein, partial [Gemmatimonadetes bacterium]|nr:carboxypeptidase-like regulatory domain-containing protein [Gemmatimonadota bacterium]